MEAHKKILFKSILAMTVIQDLRCICHDIPIIRCMGQKHDCTAKGS
jgi:hypothetical protein